MYGNILASCSYDRKVIIWKEENGTWEKTYEYTGHDSSGTWGLELGSETGYVKGFRKAGINPSMLWKKAPIKKIGIHSWGDISLFGINRTLMKCCIAG